MIHELKIREAWFDRVQAGEKRAEVRKHDRDFQVGDTLHLIRVNDVGSRPSRWVPPGRDSQGRFASGGYVYDEPITARVTHVLPSGHAVGLTDGYVLLSIEVTR